MSLNPIPAAGPPGWVVAAFQYAVGRADRSSTIDAQIRAANQAGYTRAAGYSRGAQIAVGQGLVSRGEFLAAQGGGPGPDRGGPARAGPPAVIPPVFYPPVPSPGPPYQPPPPGSGGSGSSGIPPQPPPPRPGTPPINPNAPPAPGTVTVTGAWPYVIGSVILPDVWNWTKQGAIWTYDWYRAGQRPESRPAGPARRGRRPRTRGPYRDETFENREMGNPFPPKGPDTPARERIPRAERVASILGQLGGDIYVNPKRLPVPRQPRPAPVAAPPPAKVPLWMQLLPIIGPGIFSALMPAQGDRTVVRLTDPLTQPRTDGNPFPLTGFQPSVQSFGAFGGSGAVGTNTCECKAPRKKGRKKKRTVCYSGTFIERRDGTRKTKKRKVQCL